MGNQKTFVQSLPAEFGRAYTEKEVLIPFFSHSSYIRQLLSLVLTHTAKGVFLFAHLVWVIGIFTVYCKDFMNFKENPCFNGFF